MPEFDDMFKDLWDDDFFKEFIGNRRRMERSFMERIKKLQEAVKSGKLQGRTEVTPIEKPGVKGYIFHGIFGTPDALEGEDEGPEFGSEEQKNKETFKLPETGKEDLREPVVETFTSGDEFTAIVELPGIDEHDIKVLPGNGSIQVDPLNFKTIEIDLPSNADTSKMTKTLKNGILEIKVPISTARVEDDSVKFGVV
nr:Hsp20/alpha crystallin family protein [Candidatus Njordarchaeum guaymaensis]